MFYYHIKRHRYTIVAGVPIVVLVASSLSFVQRPYTMYLAPEEHRYVTVGEQVTLDLVIKSDQPINVVSATMHVPTERLTIDSVITDTSIVNLWSETPRMADNTISFSGGIISDTGFMGTGTILTLVATPHTEGEATFSLDNATILAHDGVGSTVAHSKHTFTLWVRAPEHPSPDVNNDAKVNIVDAGIITGYLYFRYKQEYDLNNDGVIDLADMYIVLSNMSRGASIEGLVSNIRLPRLLP